MFQKYPVVEIDIKKFRHNIEEIKKRCDENNIKVAGVIKGYNGIPRCTIEYEKAGCEFIASSRLEQLEAARAMGVKTPFMLIRIPMLSEVDNVIDMTDISLNSEIKVIRALNEAASKAGKLHKVILMVDLGDLREGIWSKEELLEVSLEIENELKNLELAGVGTNLGCYGSIAATPEKLEELVECAEMIEAKIGRKLEYISGGATTSIPRIFEGNMPARINLLRIGEGIILGKDLEDLWGYDMSFMHKDAFTLKAEVIEAKEKPSYPVGEIMFDAFGFRPEYEDKGIRKKVLLGLGKVDYALPDMLLPRDKGVKVLGASSDHTIIDVTDSKREYKVGDIMEFDLCYATIVYVTNCPNVRISIIED